MLISLLFVGNEQEMNKPIHHVAVPKESGILSNRYSIRLQHSVFVLSRRRSW